MDNTEKLIVVSAEDMAMIESNALNEKQLAFMFRKTPEEHIYKRPAKGGGQWQYVTGTYVKKILNLMFGWDWDFEIIDEKFDLSIGQCYVKGKLTCRANGKTIIKMQFGRSDIKFKTTWENGKKQTSTQPLDIGNDLKAAATDALKKCANDLGIASDVYAPNEFKNIAIKAKPQDMRDGLDIIQDLLTSIDYSLIKEDDLINIKRIIDTKESVSYSKVINLLTAIKKENE